MKFSSIRALAIIVLSSASLLVVTSCSKSNNNSSSAGISATVGGSAWTNSFPIEGIYSTAGSAFAKLCVIAAPQPDINTSAWADRFASKHPGIARRRHSNRGDDQTLEHRRFGHSLPYSNRLQPQLELRIDSTLDAGTCRHVEHRLTSAAVCLSGKATEYTHECSTNHVSRRCCRAQRGSGKSAILDVSIAAIHDRRQRREYSIARQGGSTGSDRPL